MQEPRGPGWQRLRFVVEAQGGEIAPRGIAARELDPARREHETEEKPAQQEEGDRGRREAASESPATRRHEEDREKAHLEQQVVPLELQEHLAGNRERKIEKPGRGRARGGREADDEEDRRENSGAAEQMQERVARREPAEGRQKPVTLRSRLRAHPVEKLTDRENPARADEPVHLHPERDERREVAKPERAQEECGGAEVRGLLDGMAPEESRQRGRGGPVARHRAIGEFRARGEARDPSVDRAQHALPRHLLERAQDGRRAFEHAAVRHHELERAGEGLFLNLREPVRDFLRRCVVHARTGPHLPARNPLAAEAAIAVEDRQRALGRISDARGCHDPRL